MNNSQVDYGDQDGSRALIHISFLASFHHPTYVFGLYVNADTILLNLSPYTQQAFRVLSIIMETLLPPGSDIYSILPRVLGIWAVTYGAWKYVQAKRSPVGECLSTSSGFAQFIFPAKCPSYCRLFWSPDLLYHGFQMD